MTCVRGAQTKARISALMQKTRMPIQVFLGLLEREHRQFLRSSLLRITISSAMAMVASCVIAASGSRLGKKRCAATVPSGGVRG